MDPDTSKMKNFYITTDRNDTIKYESIFSDAKSRFSDSYSLGHNSNEFADLGPIQEFNSDCYTTEKYVPDKKIMCTYTNSTCKGYHRGHLHIMLECYKMQIIRKMLYGYSRSSSLDYSEPVATRAYIRYFCTTCVKLKEPERQ